MPASKDYRQGTLLSTLTGFLLCLLITLGALGTAQRAHAQANVLLIWDTYSAGTQSLEAALQGAGHTVTLSDTDEDSWDNTNPALTGFDVVIHLAGSTYMYEMSTAGQQALVDHVAAGGGYVYTEWLAFEFDDMGWLTLMEDLIILERYYGRSESMTYDVVVGQESHPVVANVPATFTFDSGSSPTTLRSYGVDEPVALMNDDYGTPGVAVREWGDGRIVGFNHASNYSYDPLSDTNIQQLFIDAVSWAGDAMPCADADGDGYTDDACGGTDCDDTDAAVNPGATEIACDYVDND